MLSYCLKCRRNKEKNLVKQKSEGQWLHQNMLFVVVKNQDLLKNKKPVEY